MKLPTCIFNNIVDHWKSEIHLNNKKNSDFEMSVRYVHGLDTVRPQTPREKQIEKNTREKTAKEYAVRESALKRSATDIISFLCPPKMARDEYTEQTPAKFVFKCRDGDIQIPEYGLLRTDFYYQERIACQGRNL